MTLRAQMTRMCQSKTDQGSINERPAWRRFAHQEKNFYEKIIFIKTTSVKYRK